MPLAELPARFGRMVPPFAGALAQFEHMAQIGVFVRAGCKGQASLESAAKPGYREPLRADLALVFGYKELLLAAAAAELG